VRKLTRDLRYLLNTTAAVLCVLIVAVWVASYFRYDGIESGTIRRPNIPGGDFVWQNWIVKYLEGRFYLEIVTVSDPSKETIASRPLGLDWHGGSWMEDDSIRVLFGLPATTHFSWSHYWFQVDTQTRTPFCLLDDHGYLVSVRTYQRRLIVIPLWALLLPPLVWTIFVLRTYRRTRRLARAGLCKKCGYDLRACAPGGRCPECGQSIPASYKPKPITELSPP